MNLVFKKEELINFFKEGYSIGNGAYGIIKPYNDNLIKVYKEAIGFYRSDDIPGALEREKLLEELKQLESEKHIVTKKEYLTMIKERLSYTKYANDLILGSALYQDYAFGVVLNYYKDYKTFTKENTCDLNAKDFSELLKNIRQSLEDLYANYIYSIDVREKNIMFDDNLNVKIIDLDDKTTKYFDKSNNNAKGYSLKNLDNCIYRVSRNVRR